MSKRNRLLLVMGLISIQFCIGIFIFRYSVGLGNSKDIIIQKSSETDDSISVVSYNLMAASKTKDITISLNSIHKSIQEGNNWDLVGMQEIAEFPDENISRTAQFIEYFKLRGINYSCEIQRQYHWLFKSAMCTRFKIVDNSYKEYPVYIYSGEAHPVTKERSARVIQCMLVQTPKGELIFCNTHTKSGNVDNAKMNDVLVNKVPRDYVPQVTTSQDEINRQIVKNRARMIITGDFNSNPAEYVTGLKLACDLDKSKCDKPYYIDHAAYFDMLNSKVGFGIYQKQPIVAIDAFRDTTKDWQTDHISPVIASFNIDQGLVSLVSKGAPTPAVMATPYVSNDILRVMSFNILRGFETYCTGDDGKGRLSSTIKYLMNNKIDVFFLQESECNNVLAKAWQDALRQQDPNARIYYAKVQYLWAFDKQLAILSRHKLENPPINQGDLTDLLKPLEVKGEIYSYLEESEHRRILSVLLVKDKLKIRLFGIHPSPRGCSQIASDIKQYVESFDDAPQIIAGDFNCDIQNIKSQVPWLVQNYYLTCLDVDLATDKRCGRTTKSENKLEPWTASRGGPIDHIAGSKNIILNQKLVLMDTYKVVRDESLIYSDHYPVYAEFQITDQTPTPIFVPSPSVIPTVSQLVLFVVDLNLDQKIDITDFALFVEYYRVGNVKIDYDKDGNTVRDIEDLNYFIQEYKKEKTDGNE